jgi:hypothetical protein
VYSRRRRPAVEEALAAVAAVVEDVLAMAVEEALAAAAMEALAAAGKRSFARERKEEDETLIRRYFSI